MPVAQVVPKYLLSPGTEGQRKKPHNSLRFLSFPFHSPDFLHSPLSISSYYTRYLLLISFLPWSTTTLTTTTTTATPAVTLLHARYPIQWRWNRRGGRNQQSNRISDRDLGRATPTTLVSLTGKI